MSKWVAMRSNGEERAFGATEVDDWVTGTLREVKGMEGADVDSGRPGRRKPGSPTRSMRNSRLLHDRDRSPYQHLVTSQMIDWNPKQNRWNSYGPAVLEVENPDWTEHGCTDRRPSPNRSAIPVAIDILLWPVSPIGCPGFSLSEYFPSAKFFAAIRTPCPKDSTPKRKVSLPMLWWTSWTSGCSVDDIRTTVAKSLASRRSAQRARRILSRFSACNCECTAWIDRWTVRRHSTRRSDFYSRRVRCLDDGTSSGVMCGKVELPPDLVVDDKLPTSGTTCVTDLMAARAKESTREVWKQPDTTALVDVDWSRRAFEPKSMTTLTWQSMNEHSSVFDVRSTTNKRWSHVARPRKQEFLSPPGKRPSTDRLGE